MEIRYILILGFSILCHAACQQQAADLVKENFDFADKQLTYAIHCTDSALATKPAERGGRLRVIPRTIERNGSLRMVSSHDWCSGFFPGTLWQMYEQTGDEKWKTVADRYTWSIEDAKFHRGTHDLGFMLYNSFGKAWHLTKDERYKEVALQAANTLIMRYNPTVGCIRSWDFNRQRWEFPVIIDNMMNLELLFWASQETGDPIYRTIAISHADKTLENHFRPDYSSYHVIDYDTLSGDVRLKETLQGFDHESIWSRGQAWGLYGFTMAYRFTQDQKYLDLAKSIADMMLSLPQLADDMVPYWDMSDPAIPETSRDASAACIMASALYELSQALREQGEPYVQKADQLLQNLSQFYRAEPGTSKGFLLLHSTGNRPSNDEVDKPISYADYYYIEALIRKSKTEQL